jgi:hypothetical protein
VDSFDEIPSQAEFFSKGCNVDIHNSLILARLRRTGCFQKFFTASDGASRPNQFCENIKFCGGQFHGFAFYKHLPPCRKKPNGTGR